MTNQPQVNAVTEAIIGAAIEVHRQLGPGLLENGLPEVPRVRNFGSAVMR